MSNNATKPDVNALFSQLPNTDDDEYTITLKNIVLQNELFLWENEVENYLNTSTIVKEQFSAFYALLIICREYNNYSRYNYYVDKYANKFANYKLYKIILSTYFRNKAILGEKSSYRKSIKYAEEACLILPTNLAVKHHYAAIIVLAIEEKINLSVDLINKAISLLDEVIIAYPKHALYYSTLGRLYAALGDYEQGIENINKAIDLEEIVDKESMVRLGNYNYYLMQIKTTMEKNKIDEKIGEFNSSFEDVKHNLDSIKTQYLEYLAFFSSILSFILVTINTVSKVESFDKCAGIILMFAGALVIVFCVFRMLLYFSSKIKFKVIKIAFCYVFGIMLLVLGYLTGNQIISNWLFK